jgi:hypothetical protein
MARVSLGGDNGYQHEPVEVDLWGRVFHTKPVTRTVKKRIVELQTKLLATTDADEEARIYADMVEAITVPANGSRKLAGAVIMERWDADKLSDEELADFAERLQEELTRPPTRTPS